MTVFATGSLLLSNPVLAVEAPIEGAHALAVTIDAENLIELYQSVPGLQIVDTRLYEDHVLGHIELSRNLPLGDTSCQSLSRIAGSKETAMVFYCNGNLGDFSAEALNIAVSCGYKRLFWLRGGFIEWQDKDYPFEFK
jgi:rhodanese-related sulfurtransferase